MPAVRVNGLDYHVAIQGDGPPLVLLHGFTGSSHSWAGISDDLAGQHRVIAVDLIGHGASAAPDDPDRYAFGAVVDDLAALSRELDLAPATWLGYSMGGRLALALAVRWPELVSDLILESATPGIEDAPERAARAASDEALATRIEEDGIPAFVQEWEDLPLWQSQRRLPPAVLARQRNIRLQNRAAGLANALRGMGQGRQEPLWQSLKEIDIPVLLIAGALDAKFAEIAMSMGDHLPQATVAIVPNAGHAVHLEQPRRFVALVQGFQRRVVPAGAGAA